MEGRPILQFEQRIGQDLGKVFQRVLVVEQKRHSKVAGTDMNRDLVKDLFPFPGLEPGMFIDMDIHGQNNLLFSVRNRRLPVQTE